MEREKRVIPMVKVMDTCIKYSLFKRGDDYQFAKFVEHCKNGIDAHTCRTILDYMSNVRISIVDMAMRELFAN